MEEPLVVDIEEIKVPVLKKSTKDPFEPTRFKLKGRAPEPICTYPPPSWASTGPATKNPVADSSVALDGFNDVARVAALPITNALV